MNTIYLCCVAQPWLRIIDVAERSLGLKPCYLVHWEHQTELFVGVKERGVHLQSLQEAWKGRGFPVECCPRALDEQELKKVAFEELIAIKMMDRLDPLRDGFNFSLRQEFFRELVGSWLWVLDDLRIDLVISPSIPHRVFDYALYVAAKMRKIQFFMFQATVFPGFSILISDLERMPLVSVAPDPKGCLNGDIRDRIERARGEYIDAEPEYMQRQKENARFSLEKAILGLKVAIGRIVINRSKRQPKTYWVKKGKRPSETVFNWAEFYLLEFRRTRKIKDLKREYEELSKPNPTQPYVFVALHYQPEETTCPTGGVYVQQELMLRNLIEVFPGNVTFLVKEHRSQFYSRNEGSCGRPVGYYQKIGAISSRIVFSDENADPFECIDNAMCTVTVSGTVGWESAVRGTPCMVFGRAWYENMPNVFKVKTRDDIKAAYAGMRATKETDWTSAIYDYHLSLQTKMVKAEHYWQEVGLSQEDSVFNIIGGLGKAIAEGKSPAL